MVASFACEWYGMIYDLGIWVKIYKRWRRCRVFSLPAFDLAIDRGGDDV